MPALITLSHGTRLKTGARHVEELTMRASELTGLDAVIAHLDLQEPDLRTVAAKLKAQGVDSGIVVPLLFSDAYHQRVDVPNEIARAVEATGLPLYQAKGLGTGVDMVQLVGDRIVAEAPADAHIVLYSVGSSMQAANEQVTQLAQEIAEYTGREISSVKAAGLEKSTLIDQAIKYKKLHILPLFVMDGLLLDSAFNQIPRIQESTGARVTYSQPLGSLLAPIVANRCLSVLEELQEKKSKRQHQEELTPHSS